MQPVILQMLPDRQMPARQKLRLRQMKKLRLRITAQQARVQVLMQVLAGRLPMKMGP